MQTVITVRLSAESRKELIDSFGNSCKEAKEHFDALHEKGAFGDPGQVTMRYLFVSGRWE